MSKMIQSDVLHIDRTFKTCPSLFNQLYIIHAKYRGEYMPVAYILTNKRNTDVYKRIFRALKIKAMEMNPTGLEPNIIITDFEAAVIEAIRVEFPNTIHYGCFFHYVQCLLRYVQTHDMVIDFYHSQTFRANFYLKCALALLPFNEIRLASERVDQEYPIPDLFKNYFNGFWLNKTMMISCFDRISERTNNPSEGYNASIGRSIKFSNKNFWAFVSKINAEETFYLLRAEKLDDGEPPRPRRKEFILKDERIQQWKDEFTPEDLIFQLRKIKRILYPR